MRNCPIYRTLYERQLISSYGVHDYELDVGWIFIAMHVAAKMPMVITAKNNRTILRSGNANEYCIRKEIDKFAPLQGPELT